MTDAKVKDMIKKRGSIKAKVTLFTAFLKPLASTKSLSDAHASELEYRLKKLEGLYEDYDALQTDLESWSEDPEHEYEERQQFEDQYYEVLGLAQAMHKRAAPAFAKSNTSDPPPAPPHTCKQVFNLPVINIPRFGGDYRDWLEFRDTYLSLIHNNDSVPSISKFHHLRSVLGGDAALVIQSIDITSDNYLLAWQLLSERFDNTRLLKNNHIQALFDLDAIKSESSAALRNLVDVTNKNLRALTILGQPVQHWDVLIIYMMSKKLDAHTYRKWEEYRNNLNIDSPTLQHFTKFINNRANLLETLNINNKITTNNNYSSSKPFSTTAKNVNTANHSYNKPVYDTYKSTSCPLCSANHFLFNCDSFRNLDIESRKKKAISFNVCLNCLRPGHNKSFCKLSGCKYCRLRHNTLLHADLEKSSNNNVTLSTEVTSNNSSKLVILSTALVKVTASNGEQVTARLLLDNASTANFVTADLCKRLGTVKRSTSSTVTGINNQSTQITDACDLCLNSCYGGYRVNICCYIIPRISNTMPGSYVNIKHIPLPSNINLADPTFNVPSPIDILVGAEVFWAVLTCKFINLGRNQPKLHQSKFGWLLSGSIETKHKFQSATCHFTSMSEFQLNRFWELDSVLPQHPLSPEERKCEEHFAATSRRASSGRFVVSIPLKDTPDHLGDSYVSAKRRFLSLERRFQRDLKFKESYVTFMKEYLQLGHMSENTFESYKDNKKNYYLPHHGVVRACSSTTKLRVVFDASAATTSGVSYNQLQMIGPTVQDDLLSILLRFRQHKFVVTGDVEKMYRAILVDTSHRSLQQIIFRFDSNEPLKTYTLNTVTYGTASAPYLATKCLVSLADQCSDTSVQRAIRHDFYVDDFIYGNDTEENLITVTKSVIDTLSSAHFHLRKWQSNSHAILNAVKGDKHGVCTKTLNLNDISCKTLGLFWDSSLDHLYFDIQLTSSFNNKYTKRSILSLVAQVFDPLGLVGPCVLEAKLIIQQLWVANCKWDDEVPNSIKTNFIFLIESLQHMNTIRIPRWVSCYSSSQVELHVFTDASERAYGACVYVRTVKIDGSVNVHLLASKNKVAPLKPTTIPRLELCGALLGARLFHKVKNSLTLTLSRCYFWCDSTIVLGWLSSVPNQLKHFVSNRVSEIQEITVGNSWSYVPSKQNPADFASRGVKADFLSASALWWTGPEFINKNIIEFPENPNCSINLPELSLHLNINKKGPFVENDNIVHNLVIRVSNYNRLVRIFTYLQRFIYNSRNKQDKLTSSLTLDELRSSELKIINICQQTMFPDDYLKLKSSKPLSKGSRLKSLTPFLDADGLIRVGGRLRNSYYSFDVKHPIVLCCKHKLTKLLFDMKHKSLFHAAPQLLLANIRQSFWPLGGRNLAKSIFHKCVRCARFNSKPIQPIMADLPTDRTYLEYPFLNTGVDYAGPVLIADRKGRGCKLTKAYISVFVCFAVKAVHLELVSDLTKEAFIAAFNRFISRRGRPQNVYSDQGTTFIGASNELARFLELNNKDIQSQTAMQGIKFHFIPAYTPHFGGLWEAAVKSVKLHLRRILGLAHLTFEELSTCLVQIEAILNSRPLTPLNTDPSDLSFLSPSHFLIGRPLLSVPHPVVTSDNINRLQRYHRIEKLRQHFWSRFSDEYVSLLQQKNKWFSSTGTLKVNDMVLVKDSNAPPLLWLLGRITEVNVGSDGVTRVAKLRTRKGTITRAYSNLCPLPCC